MFEILTNIRRRKKKFNLNTSEQNSLMLKISQSDTFLEVEDEFNRLYDGIVYQHWDMFSKNYIPPLSKDDLFDIFQEAWIKVLESRKKYDPSKNVFSWIYVIINNMILDKLRHMKRHDNISIDEYNEKNEDRSFDIIDDNFLIDDIIINEEIINLIMQSINEINDNIEREIITRRIVEGQKLKIISESMKIPMTTVHKIIKKNITILRSTVNI